LSTLKFLNKKVLVVLLVLAIVFIPTKVKNIEKEVSYSSLENYSENVSYSFIEEYIVSEPYFVEEGYEGTVIEKVPFTKQEYYYETVNSDGCDRDPLCACTTFNSVCVKCKCRKSREVEYFVDRTVFKDKINVTYYRNVTKYRNVSVSKIINVSKEVNKTRKEIKKIKVNWLFG